MLIEMEIKKINAKFESAGGIIDGPSVNPSSHATAATNSSGSSSGSSSGYNVQEGSGLARAARNIPAPGSGIAGGVSNSNNSNNISSSNSNASSNNGGSSVAQPAPVEAPAGAGAGPSAISKPINNTNIQLERLLTCSSLSVVFSQRLTSIKVLKRMWERGDITGVIDHLTTFAEGSKHDRQQLIVLSDFFNAVTWKGSFMTLDICTQLMSILERMMSGLNLSTSEPSDSSSSPSSSSAPAVNVINVEYITSAVLKSMCVLCDGYGDLIKTNSKGAGLVAAGVDLSREERMRKCQSCYESMKLIAGRLGSVRRAVVVGPELAALADRYSSYL